MKRLLSLTIVLSALLLFSGCATFKGDAGRDLALTFATMKVIEKSGDPAATAASAREKLYIADKLLDADASLTVDRLEAEVRAAIDWTRYPMSEALLIDALITAARTDLDDNIGPIEGLFDATRNARAKEILASIRHAIDLTGY